MFFSGQHVNREEYTPSAPPAEGDICWQAAHNSPQVIIVFSKGSLLTPPPPRIK